MLNKALHVYQHWQSSKARDRSHFAKCFTNLELNASIFSILLSRVLFTKAGDYTLWFVSFQLIFDNIYLYRANSTMQFSNAPGFELLLSLSFIQFSTFFLFYVYMTTSSSLYFLAFFSGRLHHNTIILFCISNVFQSYSFLVGVASSSALIL